jgi:hypothetical protein
MGQIVLDISDHLFQALPTQTAFGERRRRRGGMAAEEILGDRAAQ